MRAVSHLQTIGCEVFNVAPVATNLSVTLREALDERILAGPMATAIRSRS